MKKVVYLLALLSIIFIAGCSDDYSETDTPTGNVADCGTSSVGLPFGTDLTEDPALKCFGEKIKKIELDKFFDLDVIRNVWPRICTQNVFSRCPAGATRAAHSGALAAAAAGGKRRWRTRRYPNI